MTHDADIDRYLSRFPKPKKKNACKTCGDKVDVLSWKGYNSSGICEECRASILEDAANYEHEDNGLKNYWIS